MSDNISTKKQRRMRITDLLSAPLETATEMEIDTANMRAAATPVRQGADLTSLHVLTELLRVEKQLHQQQQTATTATAAATTGRHGSTASLRYRKRRLVGTASRAKVPSSPSGSRSPIVATTIVRASNGSWTGSSSSSSRSRSNAVSPPPTTQKLLRRESTRLTEAEKREKQRLLVKRSYYRKINTLSNLRETVGQLEKTYSQVTEARARQRLVSAPRPPRHSISALIAPPEDDLRESFAGLAVTIDELRHENEALRRQAMEQSKSRTRMGILVSEELTDQSRRVAQGRAELRCLHGQHEQEDGGSDDDSGASSLSLCGSRCLPDGQGDNHIHSQSQSQSQSQPVIRIKPMTTDECAEVVRGAYAEILEFRRRTDYITSGGSVFGWRDRRSINGEYVKFALEKTFAHRTAERVAMDTWRVLSTERGINRLYSSSMRATFHLVQQVDEFNVVFYRTLERVGQHVVLKTLVLASFVQTEQGFLVLFRSIDPRSRHVLSAPPPPTALTADVRELWVDMFTWGLFEPQGEHQEHCVDFFGGFVPVTVVTSVAFWLMEVLLIAVRCESEIVGPVFILQNGEEPKDEEEPTDGEVSELAP